MAHGRIVTVNVTTDASGDATAYSAAGVQGEIINCIYNKTDFADGVDFVVTAEDSGIIIWDEDNVNASAVRSPRQATHLNTSGAAALYAAAGSAVLAPILICNERIKIVIAAGGDTTTGQFKFVVLG
jgi:hypothetical protein